MMGNGMLVVPKSTVEEQRDHMASHEADDQDAQEVVITSALGWEHIIFSLQGPSRNDGERVRVQMALTGSFWERDAASPGMLIPDFQTNLFQILVDRIRLRELSDRLLIWDTKLAPFSLELCSGPEQSLLFEICQHNEIISTPEMPVLSISYSSLKLRTECRFVINRSSVRPFGDLLSAI